MDMSIIVLLIILTVGIFILVVPGVMEGFSYYKTPYPSQCPPLGLDLMARNIDTSYEGDQDQFQYQPGRCSAGAEKPFFAKVYNRNIISPTETTRFQMTGFAVPPARMAMEATENNDNYGLYQTGDGDIILKDYLSMYNVGMDAQAYKGIYK